MKNRAQSPFIFLFLIVLLQFALAACQASTATEPLSQIEMRCNALNATSDHDYLPFTGEAIIADKEFLNADCSAPNCQDEFPAVFYANVLVEHEDNQTEEIRVYTPVETFKSLHPKALYMEQGRSYRFCARQIEESSKPNHDLRSFLIDHIDTIQEKQEGR